MTTRDEAIALAMAAGLITPVYNNPSTKALIRLIDLARAKENEACAIRCEEFGKTLEVDVGSEFAEEIRARMKDADPSP